MSPRVALRPLGSGRSSTRGYTPSPLRGVCLCAYARRQECPAGKPLHPEPRTLHSEPQPMNPEPADWVTDPGLPTSVAGCGVSSYKQRTASRTHPTTGSQHYRVRLLVAQASSLRRRVSRCRQDACVTKSLRVCAAALMVRELQADLGTALVDKPPVAPSCGDRLVNGTGITCYQRLHDTRLTRRFDDSLVTRHAGFI